MESKIKNFLIEKNKINKNKELLETKWTSKCKKKHNVLIQNCDLWSIPKGDRWNFTAEPFKVWHHGRSYKIFEFKKNEKHRIMENNRISFQKKTQRSSFKITTCERFQIVNNDALQELSSMSSQATAWHHITGRTPESLLVKLKY